MTLFMVDLFAGRKGASAAMRKRGWRVVSVDLDPAHRPDVVADVSHLPLRDGLRPDLLWASPPCDEFSRESMPWSHTGTPPSLDLFAATIAAVRRLNPRWWIIENVRGAVGWVSPVLGPHAVRIGAQHLWGRMPALLLAQPPTTLKYLRGPSVDRPALRAEIPYEISEAVADAVEREMAHAEMRSSLRRGIEEGSDG